MGRNDLTASYNGFLPVIQEKLQIHSYKVTKDETVKKAHAIEVQLFSIKEEFFRQWPAIIHVGKAIKLLTEKVESPVATIEEYANQL